MEWGRTCRCFGPYPRPTGVARASAKPLCRTSHKGSPSPRRRTTMSAMSASTTGTDLPQHLFTAIDHVGMAVPDLDEAIAFYRDTLGMTLAHQEVNEEQGVREAMMAVGDSGSCVQLLAPIDEHLDDRQVHRPQRPAAGRSPTASRTSSR